MFSATPDSHESMTTSPSAVGPGHGHSQSQFLPGYLLGDHAPHGMASPKLWSASNISPGQRPSLMHTQHASSPIPRNMSKPEVAKCRGGGPPVRGIFSGSDQTCVVSSPVQVRPGSAVGRVGTPGPPTSGLLGTPTTARGELSISQNLTLPISPTQLDPFYTQGESLKPDDILDETWVTIFGFPPGATSFILQQFSQYGNILKHVLSAEGNWMHVHFQSKLQAKKALSKNGKVYGGRMMIGVLPCIDKSVMEDKENVILASTPMTPQAVSAELNTSARGIGTPIRPLTAAYAASRSEYEVLKNKPTPRKDQGIVSMVKEYMFGW